jgi:uncharacterized protein YkwD
VCRRTAPVRRSHPSGQVNRYISCTRVWYHLAMPGRDLRVGPEQAIGPYRGPNKNSAWTTRSQMTARALRTAAGLAPTRLIRAAGLALSLAAIMTAASAAPALAWDAETFSSQDEQLLFTLTNQDRASAGLNALTADSYLHSKAEWRAKDMADRDYFDHKIPPDDKLVFYYMSKDGYCFKVAGENIGLSTYSDAEATTRIEKAFMGSASHRANILGDWVRMGIGAYKAADGRKLYTVLFSVPCGAKATPKPTAKPAAKPTPTPTPAEPTPTPLPVGTPAVLPSLPSALTVEPSPVEPPAVDAAPEVQPVSLRVREKAGEESGQGPLEGLFRILFGGIFP